MSRQVQQIAGRVQIDMEELGQKAVEYCEGDKYHPFLEEMVTTQASFYESLGVYQRCYMLWEKYLKIQ